MHTTHRRLPALAHTLLAATALACTSPEPPPPGTTGTATPTTDTSDTATPKTDTSDTATATSGPCVVSDPASDIGPLDVELELSGEPTLELCAEAGEWLRLRAYPEEWDGEAPTLQLVDPKGVATGPSYPLEGADHTDRSKARVLLAYLPVAGHWTVEATGVTFGSFHVIREAVPQPNEPDSQAAPGLSAPDLAPSHGPRGDTLWGFQAVPLVLDAGDEDWVRIPNGAGSGPVEIWGPGDSTGSELGLDVVLYDPSGAEVASATDMDIDNRISFWDTVAGDYTLKVSGTGGSQGWNVLYLRTWDDHWLDAGLPSESEPNDSQATADPLVLADAGYPGERYTYGHGTVGDVADEDWYEISNGAADWELRVTCYDEELGGTATVSVEVVDAAGAPLPLNPTMTSYTMSSDKAWVHITGTSGRYGDTAFYGCVVRAAEEIYDYTSE